MNFGLNVDYNEVDNKFFNKCTTILKIEMLNLGYDIHCNTEIDTDNDFYNISNNCQFNIDYQFSDFQSNKVLSIMYLKNWMYLC